MVQYCIKISKKERVFKMEKSTGSIKCKCVIVAGGKGLRMGSKVKKQFLSVKGEMIIVTTIKAISKSKYVDGIIVVTGKDDIGFIEKAVRDYGLSKVEKVVCGGDTRSESVKNGLMNVGECDIVAIHDGVRPMVEEDCINKCIEDAFLYGASALGISPKDTIKVVENNEISHTLDRSSLCSIQTPQCFKCSIINEAYENFNPDFTDDCAQVEALGYKVHITEGSYKNIKITTPEDIQIMTLYMDYHHSGIIKMLKNFKFRLHLRKDKK